MLSSVIWSIERNGCQLHTGRAGLLINDHCQRLSLLGLTAGLRLQLHCLGSIWTKATVLQVAEMNGAKVDALRELINKHK